MKNSQIPSIEQTFLMIKPDGIKRGLVGEIFTRLENIGLKMVACRMTMINEDQARGNYPTSAEYKIKMAEKTYANYNNNIEAIQKDMGTSDKLEIGTMILDSLVKYITSGPVILTVWEGNHAVDVVQKIIGSTDPLKADIGSIRGDYGFDTPQFAVNSGRIVFQTLAHRSDSASEAKREIDYWFGEKFKDLGDYSRTDYMGYFEEFQDKE